MYDRLCNAALGDSSAARYRDNGVTSTTSTGCKYSATISDAFLRLRKKHHDDRIRGNFCHWPCVLPPLRISNVTTTGHGSAPSWLIIRYSRRSMNAALSIYNVCPQKLRPMAVFKCLKQSVIGLRRPDHLPDPNRRRYLTLCAKNHNIRINRPAFCLARDISKSCETRSSLRQLQITCQS